MWERERGEVRDEVLKSWGRGEEGREKVVVVQIPVCEYH